MKKAHILTGNLAQDHEFIYPFYRVLEAGFELDVCIIGGKPACLLYTSDAADE